MREYEKQSRFEQAFQRGQEGDVSSYEAWLQDQGFKPERVNRHYLTQYFQDNPEEAPNHDDQLEQIAEFIGFFSRRDGTYHIPVIGPTGIGKTQFLYTISHMISKLGVGIPVKHYSGKEFGKTGEEEQRIYEIIDELQEVEKAVICIDDGEDDKRIEDTLQKISSAVNHVFIITSWTPERWRWERDQIEDALQVSKEIELIPLNETNSISALEQAVEVYSGGEVNLPKPFFKKIVENSLGVPQIFHQILRESIRESFRKKLDLGAIEAVNSAVEKLNLENAQERIHNISDKRLTILKYVLLARHPKGRRPTELVDRLDKDKSTISYHLQTLISDRILEKERVGRSTFYRVRASLKPILQLRLAKEGEFYA